MNRNRAAALRNFRYKLYLPSTAPPSFAKVKSCTYVHNNFALCQKFKKSFQLLFIKRLFFEKRNKIFQNTYYVEKKLPFKNISLALSLLRNWP